MLLSVLLQPPQQQRQIRCSYSVSCSNRSWSVLVRLVVLLAEAIARCSREASGDIRMMVIIAAALTEGKNLLWRQ